MEKSVKITLIVCGSLLGVCGIGFGIYKLVKKSSSTSGTSGSTNLIGTTTKGTNKYSWNDCSTSGVDVQKGETIYATQDATIVFVDGNGKKYQKSYSKGDAISVAYDVTTNRIKAFENALTTLKKNRRYIVRGTENSGKIGVLRDVNGNPVKIDDTSKIDLESLIDLGTSAVSTYKSVSSGVADIKSSKTTDTSKTTTKSSANGECLINDSKVLNDKCLNKIVE